MSMAKYTYPGNVCVICDGDKSEMIAFNKRLHDTQLDTDTVVVPLCRICFNRYIDYSKGIYEDINRSYKYRNFIKKIKKEILENEPKRN